MGNLKNDMFARITQNLCVFEPFEREIDPGESEFEVDRIKDRPKNVIRLDFAQELAYRRDN